MSLSLLLSMLVLETLSPTCEPETLLSRLTDQGAPGNPPVSAFYVLFLPINSTTTLALLIQTDAVASKRPVATTFTSW